MLTPRKYIPAAGGTWTRLFKAGVFDLFKIDGIYVRQSASIRSIIVVQGLEALLLTDSPRPDYALSIYEDMGFYWSCPVRVDEVMDKLDRAARRWPDDSMIIIEYISHVAGPLAAMAFVRDLQKPKE